MSSSVEILFFWAWLIILVWENEPKLKETTVNYFEFRHHSSIGEYTSDGSELVNQDVRIVWASLISSLEVARYDCLPHHFFPNVSTSSVSRKNKKEKSFSTRVWTCNFLKFSSFGYRFMIVLWLEIHGVFLRFFLLLDSVTSAVTTYNVGFFKPTVHDLSNSSWWSTKFISCFLRCKNFL